MPHEECPNMPYICDKSYIQDGILSHPNCEGNEQLNMTHKMDNFLNQPPETDPKNILNTLRISNVNRLIVGHLNINSLRNKIQDLQEIIKGNIDILVITETKLDETFPTAQFNIDGYSTPFRKDRDLNMGGGVIIYVREDIPCRELRHHSNTENIEGIFLEINLRKSKWLCFGGYNPSKSTFTHFANTLGKTIDLYMANYDNLLLLGDFNSEISEPSMVEFCETYNLNNLIKEPTCFKNPENPSCIDVILTNRTRSFQHTKVIETGLSDHHKLTLTVLKTFIQKQTPNIIRYRDYKNINNDIFRSQLAECIDKMKKDEINYENLEKVCINLLDKHAPLKDKTLRANQAPFMTKVLSKAIMTRSRLRNRFVKLPTEHNKKIYHKHRNYCTNLARKVKRNFYNNLDTKQILDNKRFWKTVKPLFSEKHINGKKITLLEGDKIISEDREVAEILNTFFSNIIDNLELKKDDKILYDTEHNMSDHISTIIEKFKSHPSVLKINELNEDNAVFHFDTISEETLLNIIATLDKKKATAQGGIPTKFLIDYNDIIASSMCTIYNNSLLNSIFPSLLKVADITPVHKKNDTILKDNYRPISLLPPVSKIFERNMAEQISSFIEKFLSPSLCGFRKGFGTQTCLSVMIEKFKIGIDNGKIAGALLTDLSKAFDCLNHDLLIAKLHAYGFDHNALMFINSYLHNRQQRTNVNNSHSCWSYIKSGIPQGSILGPLLFNIYINDIFFFVKECEITNYADDNTPYAIDTNTECLITTLENNTNILIDWFYQNYLKLNADKCYLLVTKHEKDVHINIENVTIYGSKTVNLLGITIDNNLDFNAHVSKICKKVSSKLHALARISGFMKPDKLRIILKAFIESQFGYCPLVWMFHSRTLNSRINRLHERALRIVHRDPQLTFTELLRKDKSFTIHHRNLQNLAIEMYKVKNNISPIIFQNLFSKNENPYNLRNNNPFKTYNIHSVKNGTETISYRGPKTWALLPAHIKQAESLPEFKARVRVWEPQGCTCRLCHTYVHNLGYI